MHCVKLVFHPAWLMLFFLVAAVSCGGKGPGKELLLKDFAPKSMLRVKTTPVPRAKYPCIDAHNHPTLWRQWKLHEQSPAETVALMDSLNIEAMVNLTFSPADEFEQALNDYDRAYPGRFYSFCYWPWKVVEKERDPAAVAAAIETDLTRSFEMGAWGLKISKILGLTVRDPDGRLVPVDDMRFDPLWSVPGRYKKPVLIHVADPLAFFTPVDRFNERWEELGEHPDWSFYGPQFPGHDEILEQRNRCIERHPETTFIGAHVGNYAEDLSYVARCLDKYPNFYVDISARIAELGRQPYTARRFFLKYQDRILFGTDQLMTAEMYRIHFRFLETDDEYFDYSPGFYPQGRWKIYGLYLPDEVLRKVYRDNFLRLIGREA